MEINVNKNLFFNFQDLYFNKSLIENLIAKMKLR